MSLLGAQADISIVKHTNGKEERFSTLTAFHDYLAKQEENAKAKQIVDDLMRRYGGNTPTPEPETLSAEMEIKRRRIFGL